MFKKLFSLFAALTLSVGLWAANSVITYTASAQLTTTEEEDDYGVHVNQFFDANGQVLSFTQSFDASTQKGTMTFNGELKTIGPSAFYATTSEAEVSALYTIVIPEGVTTIGEGAFAFCLNLTSVTIPSSITTIGATAFGRLTALTDFTVSWTTAPLPTMPTGRDHPFMDTNTPAATLHVPYGKKNLYSTDEFWSNTFPTMEEFISQAIKDAAIAAVNAEIDETDNDNVKAIATDAATAINAATTVAEVNALKTLAIANIASAKAAYGDGEADGYNTGYDEGEAAVRAELPTEGYEGPAVIITKGEKVLTLFNPEKVEYQILEAD